MNSFHLALVVIGVFVAICAAIALPAIACMALTRCIPGDIKP